MGSKEMGGHHPEIGYFDPKTMVSPDARIAVVGKSGLGKSKMLVDLMFHQRNAIDFCLGFSMTEDSSGTFTDFLPASQIRGHPEVAFLQAIVMYMRNTIKKKGKKNTQRIGILTDDCMADPAFMRNVTFRELSMNSRWLNVFRIDCIQNLVDVDKKVRDMYDLVIAFKASSRIEQEKLWKNFGGAVFPKFADFQKVFNSCTGNFETLIINLRSPSTELKDCVFYYKAELHAPFTVGRPAYREMWAWVVRYLEKKRENHEEDEVEVIDTTQGKGGCLDFTRVVKRRPHRHRSHPSHHSDPSHH